MGRREILGTLIIHPGVQAAVLRLRWRPESFHLQGQATGRLHPDTGFLYRTIRSETDPGQNACRTGRRTAVAGASIDFVLSRTVRDSAALLDILQTIQPEAAFQTPLFPGQYEEDMKKGWSAL